MARIDKAREAFLKKDFGSLKKLHKPSEIRKHSSQDELHLVNFKLPEIILGGQDGLVNVLGIILGVAAATSSVQIVIVAGLAATFAESIAMGAVGYTSKLAEADYYQSEYEREKWEIENHPEGEIEEIRAIYKQLGFSGEILDEIVKQITSSKEIWLKVMMEQELKLQSVDRKDAFPSALTIGLSALIGSFIPLISFFFFSIKAATVISLIISAIILFIVGFYKARKTLGREFIKNGLEMMIIGMVSAFVGYLVGSILKIRGL